MGNITKSSVIFHYAYYENEFAPHGGLRTQTSRCPFYKPVYFFFFLLSNLTEHAENENLQPVRYYSSKALTEDSLSLKCVSELGHTCTHTYVSLHSVVEPDHYFLWSNENIVPNLTLPAGVEMDRGVQGSPRPCEDTLCFIH